MKYSLFILLLSSPAFAIVEMGNKATFTSAAPVQTITYSYSVGGSNTCLVVVTQAGDGDIADRIIDSVTYAADAVGTGALATADGGTWDHAEIWLEIAPAQGANNVVVTYSAGVNTLQGASGAIGFTGCHQTTPNGTAATDAETSATPAIPIASDIGDFVIAMIGSDSATGVTPRETQIWEVENIGTDTAANCQWYYGRAGTTTAVWDTGLEECAMVGVAIKAVIGIPADPIPVPGAVSTRMEGVTMEGVEIGK